MRLLSKGYLCKRCLVPSPAQPRRLQPFLLDSEPRGSSARRSRRDLALEHVQHTLLCSDSWGSFPSAFPTGLRALGDAPLPLPRLWPLCSAAFLWKHGNMDTHHWHHPGASASPAPGASTSSSQCHLVLWDPPRERKCFHGKPSSHRDLLGKECLDSFLPCHEPCPPRALRCSCPPSQRFPKLHTKAKTLSMHSHASLSLRVPVKPHDTTDPESLCPPQPGPVGPRWGQGAHHIPPGSAITSPLLGVLCHLCKYLCVPSCVPAVLG